MSAAATPQAFELTNDQQKAMQAIRSGRSTYVTGPGGVGKSVVLREVQKSKRTIVLAPTGLAAVNVGGQTIHSFCGMRPGASKAKLGQESQMALNNADIVAVDETSMFRADLMDMLDLGFREAMETDEPFGGKQMVFFGDHWQLEPVVTNEEASRFKQPPYKSPFFFDSIAFRVLRPEIVELTQIMRQKDDLAFMEALNAIRQGDTRMLEVFNTRVIDEPTDRPLCIALTNGYASAINQRHLAAINLPAQLYRGYRVGDFGNDLPAPIDLVLKVGSRVMCCANRQYEGGYINGDLGTVIELLPTSVKVRLDRGTVVVVNPYEWSKLKYKASNDGIEAEATGSYSQLPLKLAWAITAHKSQGQTYKRAHFALEGKPFAHGQTYVGLSRLQTLEGLTLGRRLTDKDVVINMRVWQWAKEVQEAACVA